MHSQHSGAKIRVFEQNPDIIKLKRLFCSATAHEYSFFFFNFLLANSYEPLVVSVLNHLHTVSPVVVVFFLQ